MTEITKEELENLMKIDGKVVGAVFRTDAEYIRQTMGPEYIKALKKATEELGYPIDYENMKNTEWYPIGLRIVSLLAARKAFNWGDKEIREMGDAAPNYSFVIKMLMKYFISVRKVLESCPGFWRKHYTIGSLEAAEINEKKRFAVTRLKDFKIHPILCVYRTGYWSGVIKFVVKSKEITTEETKCMFRGDPYCEFISRW